MPKAQLPTSLKGWIVSGVASLVGFVAGLVALEVLRKVVR